jgi:Flp pilus assembly protein TadD
MTTRKHVVLLIHGIRTQGEWAQRTVAAIESDPPIHVVPLRYEFFDVLRFLLPFARFRDRPVHRITALIRDELSGDPESLSVIAHSFGTFIVAKILEREPDIRFHRVILCGSIIPDDFKWAFYAHRLSSDASDHWHVVNDCGMRDIWPVFAKSITWGYGSSGRFGFGHPRVMDRFFDLSHSEYFDDAFIRQYWLPYLTKGTINKSPSERRVNPWWLSALTVFKLRNLLAGALLIGSVTIGIYVYWQRVGPATNVQITPTARLDVEQRLADAWDRLGGRPGSTRLNLSVLPSDAAREQARRLVAAALTLAPDYPKAHRYKGIPYFYKKRFDLAEKSFLRSLELEPKHGSTHHLLGLLYAVREDQVRAESELTAALREGVIAEEEPSLYNNLGNVLLGAGPARFGDARKAYLKAIQLDSHYAEPHNGLGTIMAQEGFLEDAAAQFEAAIALNAKDASALSNLERVLRELGKNSDADAIQQKRRALLYEVPR